MNSVRDLVQHAVKEGVFPGGVVLVAKEGSVLFLEPFGLAQLDPERPMTTDTFFDLASLTKPLATAPALMLLIQKRRLDLDRTLGQLIDDFAGTDKESISIRQLLSHSAGLPDYQPYYQDLAKRPVAERKETLRTKLLGEVLLNEPGKLSLYSDVGFMILEWVVEELAQKPLNGFVEESVYRPLGLNDLFFIPIDGDSTERDDLFAATEDCPWRKKVLVGEVHDDNAYVMGGVSGHAGLFGSAQAVYQLLQELLNAYSGKANEGLFREDLVRTFFQRQPDAGTWALGFDTPTRPESSSGQHFSDQSVGHLGFTGTSFWVDLVREVIVVLLTNRVHPSRDNERIKTFRPLLHDRVMEEILD
jgi:CubicO group peptidase (beta-lactamase class C family)